MGSKKVLLPEGVQDLLIDDCFYRREIENALMKDFRRWGYMEVSTPTLEYYDLFSQDYLNQNGDKMFKLIDTNGSLLVLRPDCTIPIGRLVATKMKDFVHPLKLCYIQNVFRIDREQAGKKREYRQAGVEFFGVRGPQVDAEVIITAIESLLNLGLSDFQMEIGQITLLEDMIRGLAMESEAREQLMNALENKNLPEIDRLIEGLSIKGETAQILKKLPRLFGDPKGVLRELNQLNLAEEARERAKELAQVVEIIEAYDYYDYISLDLGMVSHIRYYTGIVFKGYTKDLGVVLVSGGRYDKLLDEFDLTCPAIGFAFILNKITKALKIQQKLKESQEIHVLVVNQAADRIQAQVLKKARAEGYIAEASHLTEAEDIKDYCIRRKVDEIWYVKKDGTISVVPVQGER